MMVAHIEPGAQSAQVVSFPRDLKVEIPNSGGQTAKINSFYGSGGPDAVVEMLKWNFDIDVHHYVEVDFNTFREVVNAIRDNKPYILTHREFLDEVRALNAELEDAFPKAQTIPEARQAFEDWRRREAEKLRTMPAKD